MTPSELGEKTATEIEWLKAGYRYLQQEMKEVGKNRSRSLR